MNFRAARTTHAKTDEFPHGVTLRLDDFGWHFLGQGEVAHRIEVFDGKLQLLAEEFEGVGQVGPATGNHDPARRTAAMLAAVVIGGARNLGRQTAHRVANDHGEGGDRLIELFGVTTTESNKTVGGLLLFGLGEGHAILLGDRGSHRHATDGNAASEEALPFNVDEVTGLGPDVDE